MSSYHHFFKFSIFVYAFGFHHLMDCCGKMFSIGKRIQM